MNEAPAKTFAELGIRVSPSGQDEQATTCPKCSDDRKKKNARCLQVNIAKGVWNCHHCSFSGSLAGPGREILTFTPLPKERQPTPMLEEAKPTFYELLEKHRGITREVAERNQVQQVRHFVPQVKKERACTAFPYTVDGQVVAIKYRDSAKNFTQEAGCPRVFYKLDDVSGSEEVIVTEGEFDALSFEVAEMSYAVSVPDGAPPPGASNTGRKMQFFDDCIDRFTHVTKVILALDNDLPGTVLREELARRFGKERCWLIEFPEGSKDANDVLLKHGPLRLKDMISKAVPYPVEGSTLVGDNRKQILQLYLNGYPDVEGCGDPEIDKYLKFARGAMTVVTGTPNSGKSTYIDNVLMRHAVANDWRVSYFTPEHKVEYHVHRLCEILIGRPFLPGDGQMTADEMNYAFDFLKSHTYYIQPRDETYKLDDVLSVAEYHVRAYGIDALVIDPWNRIEHHIGKGESETIYTGKTLHRIQAFAKTQDIHVFLIAHPRKMGSRMNDSGGMSVEIPTLYSISGSANFYNMTDNGITVYRDVDQDSGETLKNTVHIQKVKWGHWGSLGTANYTYEKTCQRFVPGGGYVSAPGGMKPLFEGPEIQKLAQDLRNTIGGQGDERPF